MSTSKMIGSFSVVLAVAALGFAVWQINQASGMRVAIASERVRLREQLRTLEQRIAELELAERRSPVIPDGPVANEAGATESARSEAGRLAELRRSHQELAKRRAREAKAVAAATEAFVFSPEAQKRNFRHFQLSLPARYLPLYHRLNLSDSQIQEFERLQAERYWAISDLMVAQVLHGRPVGLTQSDFAALNTEAIAPIDAQLRTVLGKTGFEDYVHFESSIPVSGLVESLAGKLAGTAEPLSLTQWDRLAVVFATHHLKQESGNRSWLAAEVTGSTAAGLTWKDVAWEPVIQELETVLSPAQSAALQAIREQTELRAETAALKDALLQEVRSRQETGLPLTLPAR